VYHNKVKRRELNMKKRGVSGVVTTVLIILIALAAVGIIAGYLIPMLKTSGSEISAVCYNVDVEPVKCSKNTPLPGNVTVNVKRNTGDAELTKLKFVLVNSLTEESTVEEVTAGLVELQTKQYVLPDLNIGEVSVAAIVLDEAGDEKVCQASTARVCN